MSLDVSLVVFSVPLRIEDLFLFLQGCVKVWDISQPGNKSPVSQLDCLVSLSFVLRHGSVMLQCTPLRKVPGRERSPTFKEYLED